MLAALAFACGSERAEPVAPPAFDEQERLPGGDTTNTLLLGPNAFKRAASNITDEHEAAFFTGNSFFNSAWVEAPSSTTARDGLGPLFNARSCSACHFADGRGRPPLDETEVAEGLLVRIGLSERSADGVAEPDPIYGSQLQVLAIPGVPAEGAVQISDEAVTGEYADGTPYELLRPRYRLTRFGYGAPGNLSLSARVAPIMVGLGLLEAIPEGRLRELADPDDADRDGISGKLNRVAAEGNSAAIGRFGWKAEQPSVRQQTAAALLGDIGITSPLFTEQNCTEFEPECQSATPGGAPEIEEKLFDRLVLYSQLLAVPVRERWSDETILQGRALFHQLGCAACHVPRHETGESSLAELAHQVIYPYTDLLLHDLGEELADDRPVFDAEGQEWRTPPLWGLGRVQEVNGHDRLLHDGRARGVAEAILWHGGEARKARDGFVELPRKEREALVDFVESL